MVSILIAICGRQMDVDVAKGLADASYRLTRYGELCINYEIKTFSRHGLERERNTAVRYLLSSKHDYLFFLDTDIILQSDTLIKLLDSIEEKKFIISAMYVIDTLFQPAVCAKVSKDKWRWISLIELLKKGKTGLVEVDGVGAGCLLIDRIVLEDIQYPWFKFSENYGEDLYFCSKAKRAGYKSYMNMDARVMHIKPRKLFLSPTF